MSADTRAQTIYFVVVDRFHNSDPSNDQGRDPASYDSERKSWFRYWGGDLQGIIDKLDYLQGLGASTVWVTPLFDQVDGLTDSEGRGHAAYHGYWARDFRRLDEHLVANPEEVRVFQRNDTVFDKLLARMKERGMSLMLDVVCNHSSPAIQRHKGVLYDDGELMLSYEDDRLGWYHRDGGITDWRSERTVQQGELCGLADFDEHAYSYRTYIKRVMKDWLDKGVGALRVDTVKHMPLWFWQEWVSDLREHRPGLFLVGEWFLGGCYDPSSVVFANRSGMTIFDFALQRALEDTLARGSYEGFRQVDAVFAQDNVFSRATHLVTFVDNHDMPRLMSAGASPERLLVAVNLILLARGIPCIYYGTEQYLHDDTNQGTDPYNRPMMERWDTTTPLYESIRKLAGLRRRNVAIQRGAQHPRFVTEDTYVFEREWGGSICLAAFHRGAGTTIGPVVTLLPDGEYRCALSGRAVVVSEGRIAQLLLAPNDTLVLSREEPEPDPTGTRITFQLNGYATSFGERIAVVGNAPELGEWDVSKARVLRYVNPNLWEGDLDFDASAGSLIRYKYVLLRDGDEPLYELSRPRRAYVPRDRPELRTDRWNE